MRLSILKFNMFALKKQKISNILDFIEEYKLFLLKNEVFENEEILLKFFTQGGCYIFARVLKEEFPNVKIGINYLKTHCGILYKDISFDIRGFADGYNFHKANKNEIKYIEENFGFSSYYIEFFENEFVMDSLFSFHLKTKPNFHHLVIT